MMVKKKKKKERTKEEEKKMMVKKKKERERGGKKRGNFFRNLSKGSPSEKKKHNPPQCLIWFKLNGLGSSKMAKTISSTTGPLVGAGSVKAKRAHKEPESKINSISNLGLDILLILGFRV
jgi:hypothetical protein